MKIQEVIELALEKNKIKNPLILKKENTDSNIKKTEKSNNTDEN